MRVLPLAYATAVRNDIVKRVCTVSYSTYEPAPYRYTTGNNPREDTVVHQAKQQNSGYQICIYRSIVLLYPRAAAVSLYGCIVTHLLRNT